jgi:hypothetical protein
VRVVQGLIVQHHEILYFERDFKRTVVYLATWNRYRDDTWGYTVTLGVTPVARRTVSLRYNQQHEQVRLNITFEDTHVLKIGVNAVD